jgi:hypothetical protein
MPEATVTSRLTIEDDTADGRPGVLFVSWDDGNLTIEAEDDSHSFEFTVGPDAVAKLKAWLASEFPPPA